MNNSTLAINKRASFDYELIKEFNAGLVLEGWEIKSLRRKNAVMQDSFIIFKKHQPFLINVHIAPYKFSKNSFVNLDPERSRKLLLNKREIREIEKDIKLQKVIVIPTKIYLKNNLAKVKLFTAKAKKKYDKRQDMKEKDLKREISRQYKYKN